MTDFFSMPMSAGPRDVPVGVDELGNPVYMTTLGSRYVERQKPGFDGSYVKAALNQVRKAPLDTLGNVLSGAARGAWDTFSAPGRAASGENVTMGDVADVAGMVSLPALAGKYDPNRVNVGLMGGGRSDPTKTGWTFKDVDASLNRLATRSDNRAINADTSRIEEVPIREIYAMQDSVNPDFATTTSSAGELPLVVRKNGKMFVRDGHHRIVKAAEEGSQTTRTRFIDLDNADTSTPLLDWEPQAASWTEADDALLSELFPDINEPPRPRIRKYGIAGALPLGALGLEQETRAYLDRLPEG